MNETTANTFRPHLPCLADLFSLETDWSKKTSQYHSAVKKLAALTDRFRALYPETSGSSLLGQTKARNFLDTLSDLHGHLSQTGHASKQAKVHVFLPRHDLTHAFNAEGH